MRRVLIIGDDHETGTLGEILESEGFECALASSISEARKHLEERTFPRESMLDFLQEVLREHPTSTAIIVSAHNDSICRRRTFDIGAYAYITKPFHPDRIMTTLSMADQGLMMGSRAQDMQVGITG
jgi:DNA-binding NtrC family response regulator